jgi:hypothetical protein
MVIGGGVIAIIIALIYCFFGYRLARIVLPICGTAVICGLMYVFLIDFYTTGGLDKWIFVVCCAVALYVILFIVKRFAGFMVGVCGAAMALLFIAVALNLNAQPYYFPVAATICLVVGLVSAAYRRVGVIVATSLFGGCLATLVALFLIFGGSQQISGFSDLVSKMYEYLANNATMVTGIAFFFAIVGVVVQLFATGSATILAGRHGLRGKTQKFVSDEIDISDNGNSVL